MRQRVMIAMALLCEPDMLIADEPTTALDVTIEAQIVALLKDLHAEFEGSIVFVSHSLGLISEICDEVAVMYAGKIVESGPTASMFAGPSHPYTLALLACEIDPDDEPGERLVTIKGGLPDLVNVPPGCIFAARCPSRFEKCARGAAAARRCARPRGCLLAGADMSAPDTSRSTISASPLPVAFRRWPASACRCASARRSAWSARAAAARRRSPRRWSACTARRRDASGSRAAT